MIFKVVYSGSNLSFTPVLLPYFEEEKIPEQNVFKTKFPSNNRLLNSLVNLKKRKKKCVCAFM